MSESENAASASEVEKTRQEAIKKHAKTQRSLIELGPDLLRQIASFVSVKEIKTAELELSKPTGKIRFFQSTINDLSVLHDVITGNLESVIATVQNHPELLFIESDNITDPAGQIFYNVSPFQMMLFLCDDDMLKQVMHVVSPLPEQLREKMKRMHASLQQGGADLVKLNRDPRSLNFEDILSFRMQYRLLFDGTIEEITLPLLENPDGVLYYKDKYNQDHWYRANQATRTIEPIKLSPRLTLQQQEKYAHLVAQMEAMEPMSARRSNNDEHELIANIMSYLVDVKTKTMAPVELVRQGITYIQNGMRYCDTRYDFNRHTNTYRKCIRLSEAKSSDEANFVLQREVGHAQKEVMWLLQRYCEEERSFYSLAVDYKSEPFRRGFKFIYSVDGRSHMNDIYNAHTGVFAAGFGSNFGLSNGRAYGIMVTESIVFPLLVNLAGITRLIEDAKTNVVELLNSDLTQRGPAPRSPNG